MPISPGTLPSPLFALPLIASLALVRLHKHPFVSLRTFDCLDLTVKVQCGNQGAIIAISKHYKMTTHDDMCLMGQLTEQSILDNLTARY
jgi:hypothetical protein